jgi:cytochrome c-type biogenesis protein CcmE
VTTVVLLGVTVLAVSGFQDTLVYYRTPTEVASTPPPSNEVFRVAGLVVRGSLRENAGRLRFTITDGAHDLTVTSDGDLPQTFRAGEGAVVEGTLAGPRLFHADRVIVRHSNQYRPPNRAE